MPLRKLSVLALLLSACESVGGGSRTTEIITEPAGALVRVEGYGECLSPCTVAFDQPRTITIAKEGFRAQRLELKPGRSRLIVKLELVAPNTVVEESELPKL
ncbi:MAG: hypothetical protein HXY23_07385 [Parvularculaceae bacterium]|nr:hypothetical protein [Parvularculaceae bacterium]